MPHYKSLYSKDHIAHYDLREEGDTVVTIESIESKELHNPGSKKERKPVITLRGAEKKFICNVTNGNTIAKLYGDDYDQWIGKKIALYRGTTSSKGEMVQCVRVRPYIPQPKKKPEAEKPSEEQAS